MKTVFLIPFLILFACSATKMRDDINPSPDPTSLATVGPSVIFYTGIIKNGDYTAIEEELNVKFEIISAENKAIVSRSVTDIKTDLDGKFSFYANEIPPLFSYSDKSQSVDLKLTITSLTYGTRIKNFTVTFRLINNMDAYNIIRLDDNKKMKENHEVPIWSFADNHLFLYLTSHFILCTSREPWEISKIAIMGSRIMPGYEEPKELKRGLKGGFAVGGYKQAN